VRQFILIDLKGFRWKPICGDRVENSDSLNRSPCCARATSGHVTAAPPEQRDELSPSQLVELHSIPSSQAALQDIEWAGISQRVSNRLPKPVPALLGHLRAGEQRGWALTGKRMQVNVGVPSEFAEVDHHERGYSADDHVQCSNYRQKSQ